MNSLEVFLEWLNSFTGTKLFDLGDSSVTIKTILIFIFSVFLLFFLSSLLNRFLLKKVFPRYHMNVGVSQSIATIIRYIIIIIGLYLILQGTGIDLSSIGILLGALGVGIGFGLQSITSNFISGIIILFERPVKVGDRIEVGELEGNIASISARATIVITNDNIAVIVPNSDFINSKVVNWSYNDEEVRVRIPVGVSYNEDPEIIRHLLMDIALKHNGVMPIPEPLVIFEGFGDSSLDFTLMVWTKEYIARARLLKSDLYFEIFRAFKERNIEIPFPQHDVHLRSGFEKPVEN